MFKYICAAGSQVDETALDGRALPRLETKEGFSVCLFYFIQIEMWLYNFFSLGSYINFIMMYHCSIAH